LEWVVRKVIPIPQKYYWHEPADYGINCHIKLWHISIRALETLMDVAVKVGTLIDIIMGDE